MTSIIIRGMPPIHRAWRRGEMFDLFKRIVLAGLGLQARANQIVDEWVQEGQRNQRREAKWVRDILGRLEKDTAALDRKVGQVIGKVTSLVDMPSREELNQLSRKVDDLVSRFERTGARKGAP